MLRQHWIINGRDKIKNDEQIKVGYYENVNVGVIRTNGNVATIFPMNIQKNRKGKIIDERKKIKELIQERDEMNPQNDVLADQNQEQLLEIFKENLTESMNFLDSCSANEFYWISELFDDLSEYFQSQKLIECMERNAMRTGVDCAIDIEYAKKALKQS